MRDTFEGLDRNEMVRANDDELNTPSADFKKEEVDQFIEMLTKPKSGQETDSDIMY